MRRRGLDHFAEEGGDNGTANGRYVTGKVNQKQAMNELNMEEWRKVRRKRKRKMARPNVKLVIGVRMIYKRKMKGGEIET